MLLGGSFTIMGLLCWFTDSLPWFSLPEELWIFAPLGLCVTALGGFFKWFWECSLAAHPALFSRRDIEHVLQHGKVAKVPAQVVFEDHQIKRGPRPLSCVRFEFAGEDYRYWGTFTSLKSTGLEPGTAVEVLIDDDRPGIAIPIYLLPTE